MKRKATLIPVELKSEIRELSLLINRTSRKLATSKSPVMNEKILKSLESAMGSDLFNELKYTSKKGQTLVSKGDVKIYNAMVKIAEQKNPSNKNMVGTIKLNLGSTLGKLSVKEKGGYLSPTKRSEVRILEAKKWRTAILSNSQASKEFKTILENISNDKQLADVMDLFLNEMNEYRKENPQKEISSDVILSLVLNLSITGDIEGDKEVIARALGQIRKNSVVKTEMNKKYKGRGKSV